MTKTLNHSFDVAAVLGIGTTDSSPLPDARSGETILRVPAGISLQSLRDSDIGKHLMHCQDWYDKYQWAKTPVHAGTYSLRIPIPQSNNKTIKEQQTLLHEGERVGPVTLIALALLCFSRNSFPDPLKGGWARCRKRKPADSHAVLASIDGRVYVDDDWDICGSGIWAAGVRKLS